METRATGRYCRITQYDPDGSVTVREVECSGNSDPRFWEARPFGNVPIGARVSVMWYDKPATHHSDAEARP